jgi:hypothetical protein
MRARKCGWLLTQLSQKLAVLAMQALHKCLTSKNLCLFMGGGVCKQSCSHNPVFLIRSLHNTVLLITPWSFPAPTLDKGSLHYSFQTSCNHTTHFPKIHFQIVLPTTSWLSSVTATWLEHHVYDGSSVTLELMAGYSDSRLYGIFFFF